MKNDDKLYLALILLVILVSCIIALNCSQKKIDVGVNYAKQPDPAKIAKTKFGEIPVNQMVVILDNNRSKKDAESIAALYGGSVVGEIEFINLFQIETNFSSEVELIKAISDISKKEGVLNAVVNSSLVLRQGNNISCDPLDDPIYKTNKENSTAYDMIKLKNAWKLIKASGIELSDVTVGVNDDELGFASTEINIRGKRESSETEEKMKETYGYGMNSEIELHTGQNELFPAPGHSNQVINIIAANDKNGGISGVASVLGNKLKVNHINTISGDNLKKMEKFDENNPAQYQSKGKSYLCGFIVDLQKQVQNGAKVINCSFGTSDYEDKDIAKAFKKYIDKMAVEKPDVLFVAAAGNDNHELTGDNDYWGYKSPNLVTVGITNEDGTKNEKSNYAGPDGEITLSAYGNVLAERNTSIFGSSFCAPQVTGVVALMRSLNPNLSAAQIKNILTTSASKTINGKSVDPLTGAGCLNAEDAIFSVIKDLKKDESLTKESLLNLASLELTAKGGPREFTVTASVKAVSEKGTKFSIDISGSNFVLNGSKEQKLSAAGSVSWDVSLGEESKGVTVTVKRLDTDGCAIIFLSSMPEVSLSGKVTGFVDPGHGDKTGVYVFNVIEGDAKLNINGSGDAVLTYNYKTEIRNVSPSPNPKWAMLDYYTGVGTLTGNVDFYKGAGFELKGTVNSTQYNVETHGVPNKLGNKTIPIPVCAKLIFNEINKDSKKVVLKCEISQCPVRIRGGYSMYSDLEGSCDVTLISKQ